MEQIPEEITETSYPYDQIFEELCTNSFLHQKLQPFYGSSLDKIFQEYEKILEETTSMSLFPGDLIGFYPNSKYRKSKSSFSDDLGIFITKGSFYCEYRPLLWNISQNTAYVLKRSIKIEPESEYLLPSSLHHFEIFEEKMRYSHEPIYEELRKHYDTGMTLQRLKK